MEKTLMDVIVNDPRYRKVRGDGGSPEEIQTVLNRIASDVCAAVSPEALCLHNSLVYTKTAHTYARLEDHRQIIPELLDFISELGNWDCVLDIGCGPLARDTLFLSTNDEEVRRPMMSRMKDGVALCDQHAIPHKMFMVTALDGSVGVVSAATTLIESTQEKWEILNIPHFPIQFVCHDMHDLGHAHLPDKYEGVWSCAALFTHTPRALVSATLQGVASVLIDKGIFVVSYPCGKAGEPYDSLLYSRTGEIKYFSKPEPTLIAVEAEKAGFSLRKQTFSDLIRGTEVKKDFFVSQIFQKH